MDCKAQWGLNSNVKRELFLFYTAIMHAERFTRKASAAHMLKGPKGIIEQKRATDERMRQCVPQLLHSLLRSNPFAENQGMEHFRLLTSTRRLIH